jgi:sugar (pentulose or hexulose) kinase
MSETWEKAADTIREVVSNLDSSHEIVGVCATAQGDGCWLIDEEGDPVRTAILWSDGRAQSYLQKWNENDILDEIFDICGTLLFPGTSLAILCWLRDNEPESIEATETIFFCKDWLKYNLTGERTSDYSDMSIPYLDIESGEYSTEILSLVDMNEIRNRLPEIIPADEVAGHVTAEAADRTGLPEGVPVISGMLDVAACAFGSGTARPGESSSVLGTTTLNQTLLDEPDTEPSGIGQSLMLGVDGLWMRVMAMMSGTPNIDWAVETLLDTDDFEEIEARIEDVPVGSNGVLYHPYLSSAGERVPFFNPNARAQFTGLTSEHTADEMINAVYEGVAMAVRDSYRHIPSATDTVYLSGGGANSEYWCQQFADCLGSTVIVAEGTEFGAKGAALLAGIGIGTYSDVQDAVEKTTSIDSIYEPRPEKTAQFDQWHEVYRRTYEAMFEVWDSRERVHSEISSETE